MPNMEQRVILQERVKIFFVKNFINDLIKAFVYQIVANFIIFKNKRQYTYI